MVKKTRGTRSRGDSALVGDGQTNKPTVTEGDKNKSGHTHGDVIQHKVGELFDKVIREGLSEEVKANLT